MSNTRIKSKTVFYVESEDSDLDHCGYCDTFEQCANSIATHKMYSKQKFSFIDYDNEEEFEYFQKVEKRFTRFLIHYLTKTK